MPASRSQHEPDGAGRPLPQRTEPASADERDFRASFGEELRQVLDVGTWQTGRDLTQEYARIEREVIEAVRREDEIQRRTRSDLFPKLFDPATAPPAGGVYAARRDALELVHRGLLFN